MVLVANYYTPGNYDGQYKANVLPSKGQFRNNFLLLKKSANEMEYIINGRLFPLLMRINYSFKNQYKLKKIKF